MSVLAATDGLSVLAGATGAAIVTAIAQLLLARSNRRQSDAQADVHEANAGKIHVETADDIVRMLREAMEDLHVSLLECQTIGRSNTTRIRFLEQFIRSKGIDPPDFPS